MQSDLSMCPGRLWSVVSVGHFTWSEGSTQSNFARCFYRCTKVLRVSPWRLGGRSLDQQSHWFALPATLPNLPFFFQSFLIFSHSGISRHANSWCFQTTSSDSKPARVTRIPPYSLPRKEETYSCFLSCLNRACWTYPVALAYPVESTCRRSIVRTLCK